MFIIKLIRLLRDDGVFELALGLGLLAFVFYWYR